METLEDRCLLSVTWIDQGPGPILDGQCEAGPDNLVVGAVEALAADPSNPNVVYAGTVAGGVWKTTNFLQVGGQPNWLPLTDQQQSLAIGALAISPLDASHNTLFAGTGNFKSGVNPNGQPIGILRTTNGGLSWDLVGQAALAGHDIRSVIPTSIGGDLQHQVVLVAAEDGGGVFRSTDGGATFTPLSGINGLGDGLDNNFDGSTDEANEVSGSHLVGDPGSPTRFFAGVPGQGIFRSTDAGQTWTRVNSGITNFASTTRIELSVSAATGNTVYAALLGPVAGKPNTQLQAVYFSTDHGNTWTAFGMLPNVTPSGQGDMHFSILADPTHANLVYVGGDVTNTKQYVYVGNLARGDTTTHGWTAISDSDHTDDTAPHADSRDMIFISTGIVEADDGGVYHLSDPAGEESIWTAKSGNLRVTEFYSVAYDNLSNEIIGGTQDTGVAQQDDPGSTTWESLTLGDGGSVDVGYFTFDGDWRSIRYSIGNNFQVFRRQVFDDDGDYSVLNALLGGQADLIGLDPVDVAFGRTGGFRNFPLALNRFIPAQLVFAGSQLYESGDWADSLTTLNVGGRTQASALAYGGMLAGAPNIDVLYAGFTNTLLLRTAAGTTLTPTNYAGPFRGTPIDIVMDPDDWRRVYVTNGADVFYCADATNPSATWTAVGTVRLNGNLAGLTNEIYSIELYNPTPTPGDEVVLVGGRHGVFRTFNPDAGASALWFEVGANLPNAPVRDLRYDATDDVLLAGTHGRGAWTVAQAGQELRPTYDLRGFAFDVPATIDWSETFTLTGRVFNGGDAPVIDDFVQRFYLSDDLQWSEGDDYYLGSSTYTDTILPGSAGDAFAVTLTMPTIAQAGFTGSGPFYIGMRTDRDQDIAETNENNNDPPAGGLHVDYDSFNIPPTADLRGWSALVQTTIAWGETFTVLGQVHNAGTQPVTATFRQQFFLAPDDVWGDFDEIYLGYCDHAADIPGPGVGPTFLATLTLPSTAPAGFSGTGPFYIGMTTDAFNNVAETDEANNFPGVMGLGFDYDSFNVPGTYDLRGWECYVPSTIGWGETFMLQGRVQNDGSLPITNDFRQQFFLAPDNVWGDGDEVYIGYYQHTQDVPANGQGPGFLATLTLPSSAPLGFTGVGPFYIGMTTDALGNVSEANEANNSPGSVGPSYDYDAFSLATNDDFAYRIDLGSIRSVTDTGNNVGYSAESGEPVFDARTEPVTSAWWSWTAPADGHLTVDAFGSDFDTWLSLWTGAAVNNLTLIAENDDASGTQSLIATTVAAGTQYQIAVDGYGADAGDILLNLSFTNNDYFAQRIDLGSVSAATDARNNGGFTGESGEPVIDARIEPLSSAWWSWTAPADGVLTVDAFGSNFDTWLSLWTGDTVSSLTLVAHNDDYGGVQSRVSTNVAAGMEYQIAADGYGSATGNIALNLSFANNDQFAERIDLGSASSLTDARSNGGYTGERGELAQSGPIHSAWWSWTAPSDGILTVDTFGSNFDTWLTLATGPAVDSLRREAQNDDSGGTLQSRLTEIVAAGTQYQIAVDGYQNYTGSITLNLAFTAGVPNLAPNQPAGWSNKIVVSKTPGTYVDDPALYSTDALYVDWSGFNNGTADATVASTADLYLDGGFVQTFAVPPLGPGSGFRVTDYALGNLTAGGHTLRIVMDSANVVLESDEADNVFERTFTVNEGLGSIRIVIDAVPDDSQDFRVTCSLGALLLDDDLSQMLSNSGVFSGVIPGAYVVVEDAVVTWALTNVTITGDLDGGSSVNLANRAVTLDLDPGENISVVFVNERQIHPGDYDVDGDVDGDDLTVWRNNFGMTAGGEMIAGDGDGDQDADGADFLIWQRNLGFGAATAASSLPTSSEPDGAAEAAIAGSMTTMTAATPTGFRVPSALSAAALGEDAHFDNRRPARDLVFATLTTDRLVDALGAGNRMRPRLAERFNGVATGGLTARMLQKSGTPSRPFDDGGSNTSAPPRSHGRGLGRIEDGIDEAFAEMSRTELSEPSADCAVYLTVGRRLRSLIPS